MNQLNTDYALSGKWQETASFHSSKALIMYWYCVVPANDMCMQDQRKCSHFLLTMPVLSHNMKLLLRTAWQRGSHVLGSEISTFTTQGRLESISNGEAKASKQKKHF